MNIGSVPRPETMSLGAHATRMPVSMGIRTGYSAGRAMAQGDFEEDEQIARARLHTLLLG